VSGGCQIRSDFCLHRGLVEEAGMGALAKLDLAPCLRVVKRDANDVTEFGPDALLSELRKLTI
jgi:hypothetical protein